jgi:membrane-associated HD superfamily phosphohydrolase
MNHITKGIELAKKNYIPQEVIDFIPMHHGTMVISYFYEKAKKMYGEENIDINKYRYNGPKPNTKETAIVMLADACESTVRSLNNPDAEKVENVINNLIDSRIEDEQLNESPLTFNDLRIIRKSFLSILVGYQHKRLRYPNQEELENKKTES